MAQPDLHSRKWLIYEMEGQERGPFDLTGLAAELRYNNIGPSTLTRAEDEETWLPFDQRPEFALAQQIPLEVIARRIETRERKAPVPSSKARAQNLFVAISVVSMLILAAMVLNGLKPGSEIPSTQPAATSSETSLTWKGYGDGGFSVECPAALEREALNNGVVSYRAIIPHAGFGIDMTYLPQGTSPGDDAKFGISTVESTLLNGLHAESCVAREVTGNGYKGRDIAFVHYHHGEKFAGGARILIGNGKVGMAWVTSNSAEFAADDVDRFLKSFQFR